MVTEKLAAILSASVAWAAAAAIVGTHACRSSTAATHPPNALVIATLHGGAAEGQALADKQANTTRFIVEVEGAHPGLYEVVVAKASACPWDQRASGTTGAAGEANPSVITDEPTSDRVDIGPLEVAKDGRGALDTTVPVAAFDTTDPNVLAEDTLVIRDVERHALIACGRFVEGPKHIQHRPNIPVVPIEPVLPPG